MSEIKDGGPAFPRTRKTGEVGMSLRDYFAAKAMQGLLACNALYGVEESKPDLAIDAYEHADAMIAARSQP